MDGVLSTTELDAPCRSPSWPEKLVVREFIELLSDSETEDEAGDTALDLQREWLEAPRHEAPQVPPATERPKERRPKMSKSGEKWRSEGKTRYLSAYAKWTRPGTPVPPLSLMSGLWVDSMDNFLTLDLLSRSVLLHDAHGVRKLDLSNDRWGRLWCGNYVLQEVGYDVTSAAAARRMPPTCLAWRTTQWQISVWHRIEPGAK